MYVRVASAGLAVVAIAATAASAAVSKADPFLQSLIGKDGAPIERSIGLPDEWESNGVQTLLRYLSFGSWRTAADQTFSRQSYFDCLTTLALRDGILRAHAQKWQWPSLTGQRISHLVPVIGERETRLLR